MGRFGRCGGGFGWWWIIIIFIAFAFFWDD